jgi:chromate reductase, NAD(P)H dehydrogenase (quinone)
MIQIIVGTNRPGANSRLVAGQVAKIYTQLGVPHGVIDLSQLPAEVFAASAYASKPAGFRPFAEAVLAARGLVVVTPEYNGSMPGVLKYFIDLLKFPESFERRPVCFVGVAAGLWGALRPVEQLQQIFGYRNAHIYPERVLLPQINNLLDGEGRLNDAELLKRLKAQAEGFVEFIERLQGTRLRP